MDRFAIGYIVGSVMMPAVFASDAIGGTPSTTAFTYQGQLKLGGVPVGDTTDFEISLWDAEVGGSQVGPLVPKDAVQVKNGLFQLKLDFGASAFGGVRWLALSVRSPAGSGSFEPLLPRQQITSSPYSIQTRGIFVDANNNVGIGTSSPKQRLHNTGDYYGRGHIYLYAFEGDGSDGTAYLQARDDSGTSSIGLRLRTQDGGDLRNTMHLAANGNVGIGTSTPNFLLSLGATLSHTKIALFETGASNHFGMGVVGGQFSFHLNGSGARYGFYDSDDLDNEIFTIAGSGNVGIGRVNPSAKLDVQGDAILYRNAQGAVRARISDEFSLGGFPATGGTLALFGPNGNMNVELGPSLPVNSENRGYVGVFDENGVEQAWMQVGFSGEGLIVADVKNFRMDHPNRPGMEIWYASLEGPEAAAYVRGTATLVDGHCRIELPEHFVAAGSGSAMTVQLTPLSADSKGLAVVSKNLQGIEVRELYRGRGTYDFDYMVTDVRDGHEDYKVIRPAVDKLRPVSTEPLGIADSRE